MISKILRCRCSVLRKVKGTDAPFLFWSHVIAGLVPESSPPMLQHQKTEHAYKSLEAKATNGLCSGVRQTGFGPQRPTRLNCSFLRNLSPLIAPLRCATPHLFTSQRKTEPDFSSRPSAFSASALPSLKLGTNLQGPRSERKKGPVDRNRIPQILLKGKRHKSGKYDKPGCTLYPVKTNANQQRETRETTTQD